MSMDDELGRDDDVGTNDGMRPGGAQEVTTPEIRVSTVSCLDHGLECVLCEPQGSGGAASSASVWKTRVSMR